MQDPALFADIPEFICPQCQASFLDDVALNAHRDEEHEAEVNATPGSAEDHNGNPGTPRPTEPAP